MCVICPKSTKLQPLWQFSAKKTGNKLQYIVNNGGQNNVIIAKKSNFIHRYEIAHKTAFFSTRIMAPHKTSKCTFHPRQNTILLDAR